MNLEEIRGYCLNKNGVSESLPFDENVLVFKVMNKMFLLTNISNAESVNVKCNPKLALELREKFPNSVLPGYHMNKKHWNTIVLNGELNPKEIQFWIDHSYDLIVTGLKKSDKEKLLPS